MPQWFWDFWYAVGFIIGAAGPFVLALALVFLGVRWVLRKFIDAPPQEPPHSSGDR